MLECRQRAGVDGKWQPPGCSSTDRRRLKAQQHTVKTDDLRPVGSGRVRGLVVERGDGGLDGVNASPCAQGFGGQPRAFGDHGAVPEGAVLVFEQDKVAAVGGVARHGAGVLQQHQGEETTNLGLARKKVEQDAAEADGFVGERETIRVGQGRLRSTSLKMR